MLFVAYKQGSTRTHRVDNAVTCEEARNMVANWVGVGAEQVFLWWSASMIEDAFPQEARLLLDDDETLYEHGAIYLDITNDLGDQDNLSLASMPCFARFLRFGGVGLGPPPVLGMTSRFPHRIRVGTDSFSFGGVLRVDTSTQLRDEALTSAQLRVDALASANLRVDALTSANLRVDALTSANLRDDVVASAQVQEDYRDIPELVQDSDDDMEMID